MAILDRFLKFLGFRKEEKKENNSGERVTINRSAQRKAQFEKEQQAKKLEQERLEQAREQAELKAQAEFVKQQAQLQHARQKQAQIKQAEMQAEAENAKKFAEIKKASQERSERVEAQARATTTATANNFAVNKAAKNSGEETRAFTLSDAEKVLAKSGVKISDVDYYSNDDEEKPSWCRNVEDIEQEYTVINGTPAFIVYDDYDTQPIKVAKQTVTFTEQTSANSKSRSVDTPKANKVSKSTITKTINRPVANAHSAARPIKVETLKKMVAEASARSAENSSTERAKTIDLSTANKPSATHTKTLIINGKKQTFSMPNITTKTEERERA